MLAFGGMLVAIIATANAGNGSPFLSFVGSIPMGDKVAHLGLVGTFSLLLNASLRGRRAPGRLRIMMLGSLVLLVAMSLEECSQIFITSRTFDGFDWLANAVGVALGEWLLRGWMRWRAMPPAAGG